MERDMGWKNNGMMDNFRLKLYIRIISHVVQKLDSNIKKSMKEKIKIRNVLSLFDGISCGQIALNKAGIEYENYYASEIELSPIKITQHHYPNTIQLGDVTKIKSSTISDIDLLIGGSPCQSFSNAGKREGFDGESKLFWEYVRLLKEIKPKYFLLENVIMKQEWQDIITEELGVKPMEINSGLFSAQNRRRLYWTNIPIPNLPLENKLTIRDIIFDNDFKVFSDQRIENTKQKTKNYVKWDISGKGYFSQQDRAYYLDGKMCTVPIANPGNKLNICLDYEKGLYRRSHPVEAERFQTLPDFYTDVDGMKDSKRLEAIGNGWTVDVIAHIFGGIE